MRLENNSKRGSNKARDERAVSGSKSVHKNLTGRNHETVGEQATLKGLKSRLPCEPAHRQPSATESPLSPIHVEMQELLIKVEAIPAGEMEEETHTKVCEVMGQWQEKTNWTMEEANLTNGILTRVEREELKRPEENQWEILAKH